MHGYIGHCWDRSRSGCREQDHRSAWPYPIAVEGIIISNMESVKQTTNNLRSPD